MSLPLVTEQFTLIFTTITLPEMRSGYLWRWGMSKYLRFHSWVVQYLAGGDGGALFVPAVNRLFGLIGGFGNAQTHVPPLTGASVLSVR